MNCLNRVFLLRLVTRCIATIKVLIFVRPIFIWYGEIDFYVKQDLLPHCSHIYIAYSISAYRVINNAVQSLKLVVCSKVFVKFILILGVRKFQCTDLAVFALGVFVAAHWTGAVRSTCRPVW